MHYKRLAWQFLFKNSYLQILGNKAKGRISKRVLQENKARQIFQKNEHLLTPDTHTCVFCLLWRALFSCNTRFEI